MAARHRSRRDAKGARLAHDRSRRPCTRPPPSAVQHPDKPRRWNIGRKRWLQVVLIVRLLLPLLPDPRAGRVLVQRQQAQYHLEGLHLRLLREGLRTTTSLHDALMNSLIVAFGLDRHVDDHRHDARASRCYRYRFPAKGAVRGSRPPADRHPGDLHGRGNAGLLRRCSTYRWACFTITVSHIAFSFPFVAVVDPSRAWPASTSRLRRRRAISAPAPGRPSGTSPCPT